MAKPKILVIDDEEIVRVSCKKCLAPEGYDVDVAPSGIEGMKMAETSAYDLILTDLKMPDMDGMEFLLKTREKRPAAKVIMITGYSTVENAVKAIKSGAFNYIEKPFTPDALVAAVKDALDSK
ncbi:MAG TPA: response regulator [Thermodesulfovibrionales bacterium]|jgi:DNA-binding NtrC family response regulator|nr:response regulator [Thermodesulfovibrionales bacterium]